MRGKFITLEGCDGVGKTTQIRRLQRELNKAGVDFVFTREPGGTVISERIRDIILDASLKEMDAYTEILLYAAARRQHVAEFIEKKLAAGTTVFCDRFVDSTLAYQGYGRGVDPVVIQVCNRIAVGNTDIDLTVFFDLPPAKAFARKGGADKKDRIESESLEFHQRVYDRYKKIAASSPERVAVVDASGTPTQVFDRLWLCLKEHNVL